MLGVQLVRENDPRPAVYLFDDDPPDPAPDPVVDGAADDGVRGQNVGDITSSGVELGDERRGGGLEVGLNRSDFGKDGIYVR